MRTRTLALLMFLLLLIPTVFISETNGQSVPFVIIGLAYDTDGETLLVDANITLTNNDTGEKVWTIATAGSFSLDLNSLVDGAGEGDILFLEASFGDRYGINETVVHRNVPYLQCNVSTMSVTPRIDHIPLKIVDENDLVEFKANVVDDLGVAGTILTIWNNNSTTDYAMDQDNNNWTREIHISSLYWPSFAYSINATDGRHNATTPVYTVWVNDSHDPTITVQYTSYDEGEDIHITGNDDRGIVDGDVNYDGNIIPLDPSTGATIPGTDVQLPNLTFIVNVWDTNNTISQEFMVEVLDITPPTSIPAISATPELGTVNITLTWTAATDNVAIGGYTIDRSTDQSAWTEIAGPGTGIMRGSGDLNYTDLSCDPNTTYYYRVQAYDTALEPNYGPYKEANTTTYDVYPPEITHTQIEYWPEEVSLTIIAAVNDSSPVTTEIWYDNGTIETNLPMTLVSGNWTYTIPGIHLEPQWLHYRIIANDGNIWRSSPIYSTWINDTTPPSGLSTSMSIVDNDNDLPCPLVLWNPATDNVGVEDYLWHVQTTPYSQPPPNYNHTSQTGHNNRRIHYVTALPNTTYYFALAAVDKEGNIGPWDTNLTATTPTLDSESPVIFHNAPGSAMEGENLVLDAIITDPSGVEQAWITYHDGTQQSGEVEMTHKGGNQWRGIIPFSNAVGEIHYYINATDTMSNPANRGNDSDPFIIVLASRMVPATMTQHTETNMTPGEGDNILVQFMTVANATWYLDIQLEGMDRYIAILDDELISLDGITPLFLEEGTHSMNLTIVFPEATTETATGRLYLNQTDADNTVSTPLVFIVEEEEDPVENSWIIYGFAIALILLLVIGTIMRKRFRPKNE